MRNWIHISPKKPTSQKDWTMAPIEDLKFKQSRISGIFTECK